MEEKCKFCNPYAKNENILEKFEFTWYINEGRLYTDYQGKTDFRRINMKINFCPICGRDLTEKKR